MNPRHDNYSGKQRRKAYVLYFVRAHSETAHKAHRAYAFGLAVVLLIILAAMIALVVWQP